MIDNHEESVWTEAERNAWSPKEEVNASDWVEEYRFLSSKHAAEAGRFDLSRTPYCREILNAFSDDRVQTIVFCSGTQVGKTETLVNSLMWMIDVDPAPALFVMPREPDANSMREDRLKTAVNISPEVKQHFKSTKNGVMYFDQSAVYFAGSGSAAGLASRPIRYLFMDELDKFEMQSGKESDPVSLALERTKTYYNRKVYMCSTPTTKQNYIWERLEATDYRQFHVPCPDCGEFQTLVFDQVKFGMERNIEVLQDEHKDPTYYECAHCQSKWDSKSKGPIMQKGVWVPRGKQVKKDGTYPGMDHMPNTVGYHLPGIYSIWLRWGDIAAEFLKSKDNPRKLMNFYNSWLGIPWQDDTEDITKDSILNKQVAIPQKTIPFDAQVLTAGVDVQGDCFYVSVVAWEPNMRGTVIDYYQVESWAELRTKLFESRYGREGGDKLPVRMAFIDSGYDTASVYDFCHRHKDVARPIKGAQNLNGGNAITISDIKNDKGARGQKLYRLDTGYFKSLIAKKWRAGVQDFGTLQIHENPGEGWIKQNTAEYLISEIDKKTGYTKQYWAMKPNAGANHYFDTLVYAYACAEMLGVEHLKPEQRVDYTAQHLQPDPVKKPTNKSDHRVPSVNRRKRRPGKWINRDQ